MNDREKHRRKHIMPAKQPQNKKSAKAGKSPAKKLALKQQVKLKVTKAPAGESGTVDGEVLECIGQQSGGKTITSHATLAGLGVKGIPLAGCLEGKFGPKFKGGDFPGTMEVVQCILLVRSKVP
jgi:hypothetical protein